MSHHSNTFTCTHPPTHTYLHKHTLYLPLFVAIALYYTHHSSFSVSIWKKPLFDTPTLTHFSALLHHACRGLNCTRESGCPCQGRPLQCWLTSKWLNSSGPPGGTVHWITYRHFVGCFGVSSTVLSLHISSGLTTMHSYVKISTERLLSCSSRNHPKAHHVYLGLACQRPVKFDTWSSSKLNRTSLHLRRREKSTGRLSC